MLPRVKIIGKSQQQIDPFVFPTITKVKGRFDPFLLTRQTCREVIHHSDRGLQYCSTIYQQELKRQGMTPSMTDGYDCYQNALAERMNGILKQEFLINRCRTLSELKVLVRESVDIYNRLRPHLSLDMKTPEEVHKKATSAREVA